MLTTHSSGFFLNHGVSWFTNGKPNITWITNGLTNKLPLFLNPEKKSSNSWLAKNHSKNQKVFERHSLTEKHSEQMVFRIFCLG